MAPAAERDSFLFPHVPAMRLMTVETLDLSLREVEAVLADLGLVAVAGFQAIGAGGSDLAMGVMAVEALQVRHGALCRDVFVAGKTTVIGDHLGRLFPVAVAPETCHALHAHAVYYFVLVARLTGLLVRNEFMECAGVALAAADVLHEDVARMAV